MLYMRETCRNFSLRRLSANAVMFINHNVSNLAPLKPLCYISICSRRIFVIWSLQIFSYDQILYTLLNQCHLGLKPSN